MTFLETLQAGLLVALIAVGSFFLAVGTIGLLRFPNVYNRMHATSKPTTLGTAAVFLAGFVEFGPGGAGLTCLLGIVFLFLTVPTGAHMIARSAEKMGVPFEDSVTWPDPPDGMPHTVEESDRAPEEPGRTGGGTDRSGGGTGGTSDGDDHSDADGRTDDRRGRPRDGDEPADGE